MKRNTKTNAPEEEWIKLFDWTNHLDLDLLVNTILVASSLLLTLVSLNACNENELTSNQQPLVGQPKVETGKPLPTSTHGCLFSAQVVDYGVNPIVDYGFVYGPSKDLTNSVMSKFSIGKSKPPSSFEREVKQLNNPTSDTTYVTAYLTTARGTAYGKTIGFKLPVFNVNSIVPDYGKAGDKVTITTESIDFSTGVPEVLFNTTKAYLIEASKDKLVVEVPSGITLSDSYIAAMKLNVNGTTYILTNSFKVLFSINTFSPKSGSIGTEVSFMPDNLPSSYLAGGLSISFGDVTASLSNSNQVLKSTIPSTIKSDHLTISFSLSDGQKVVLTDEFVVPDPTISSVVPNQVFANDNITINGTNFALPYGVNIVKIGDTPVNLSGGSSSMLFGVVPSGISTGAYKLSISTNVHTIVTDITVLDGQPAITSISPTSGTVGTVVTILGTFSSNPQVTFDGVAGTIKSATSSKIEVIAPKSLPDVESVTIRVSTGRLLTALEPFHLIKPKITNFTPSSGKSGTLVTITGNGFSPVPSYNHVKIGDIETLEVVSATETSITARILDNAINGPGKIAVKVNLTTCASATDFTIVD